MGSLTINLINNYASNLDCMGEVVVIVKNNYGTYCVIAALQGVL